MAQSLFPKIQPMSFSDFFKTIGKGFSPGASAPMRTQNLPNDTGSYQTPSGQKPSLSSTFKGPVAPGPVYPSVVRAGAPASKTVTPTSKGTTPSSGSKTGAPSSVPPQWINPATGGFYTPDEIAANLARTAPGASNGDIPKFAGDSLTQGPQTTEQLQQTASGLNNARNDIAVGEKDPYKIGSESGVAYTPAELKAIESAYSGVYDPAINSALSKLDQKQKSDQEEREFQHDMKKMETQFQYDKALKAIGTGGGTGSSNQIIDNERAAQTLFQNNPIVKDYNTVIGQKNSLDRIVTNGVGGPADVNAIFNFMKALDPNSVVRESEYDKAASSGNLFQGIWTKFNGYFKDKGGFLPDNVRQEFQNLVDQKLQAQKVAYDNVSKQTREIVQRQGLNPDNVVIDFSGGIQNLETQGPAQVDQAWLAKPDYDNDLILAKQAIAAGADPAAVRARLLTKYKEVPQL